MKFSVLVASKEPGFDFLTESEITDLMAQIDGVDIDISNDIQEIYLAAKDLLTIQDYRQWEASLNDLSIISNFDSEEQDLFINALNRFVNLDILNVVDPILSIGMYDKSVVDQITWLETPEERVALLDSVRLKIASHNGAFVSKTLGELVALFETSFYNFPGIDLDLNGTTDVTLGEFIEQIQDLSILLNADPAYHAWFKEILDGIGSLSMIDVFMEPFMGIAYSQISGTDGMFDAAELDLLKNIIETNFSDQADLQRELTWMAEVYQAIGNLEIGGMLQASENPIIIMDTLLVDSQGQILFKKYGGYLLRGTKH